MDCFFCTVHAAWPWLRQTEDGSGRMGDVRFVLEEKDGSTPWLVVFDEPPAGAATRVPRERRVLFVTEPPEIKRYPRSYLGQFGTVISTKTATEAQRRRIRFVRRLKDILGDDLDVFGRGFRPVSDKAEAIAPYAYHLVLENNYIDNFWTEKLADAWIGWALPLYLGAPNLAAACGLPDGFVALDPDDEEGNLARIAQCLGRPLWEERREALARCRAWCLQGTNVFARTAALIRNAPPGIQRLPMSTRPESLYGTDRQAVAALYGRARA